MEWKDLKRVNESLTTVDVKGKGYVEVNKRVMAFREIEPNGTIATEIVNITADKNGGGIVTMKATVFDGAGRILATGTAQEKESSSYINKTSYIENCETSAVGRALGFCGIGVDSSIASAEEVENAIRQQEQERQKAQSKPKNDGDGLATAQEKKIFLERCEQLGVDYRAIAKQAGAKSMKTMSKEEHGKCLLILRDIEESRNE
jgi:hypothetical protein